VAFVIDTAKPKPTRIHTTDLGAPQLPRFASQREQPDWPRSIRSCFGERQRAGRVMRTFVDVNGLDGVIVNRQSDYFHEFKAPLPVGTALTADAFKTALEIGRRYRIDLSPADRFFAGASDAENWPDYAAAFRQLDKVMHAALSDVSTAFARADNVVRVRMWLFGRTEDGWLVGLRSIVTET
jgi:hypothetical protein